MTITKAKTRAKVAPQTAKPYGELKAWQLRQIQTLYAMGLRALPVELKPDGERAPASFKSGQMYRDHHPKWSKSTTLPDVIGVPLGDYILLDADLNKPGAASVAAVEMILGQELGEPFQIRRSDDSRHYLFKRPASLKGVTLKQNAIGRIAPGWDLLTGNQVVYLKADKELPNGFPKLADVPDAPQPVIDILTPEPEPVREAVPVISTEKTSNYGRWWLDQCEKILAEAIEGSRLAALNKAALKTGRLVAGGEIEENEAREALSIFAARAGLKPGEINRAIKSAFAKGAKNPEKAPELRIKPRTTNTKEITNQKAGKPAAGVIAAVPPPVSAAGTESDLTHMAIPVFNERAKAPGRKPGAAQNDKVNTLVQQNNAGRPDQGAKQITETYGQTSINGNDSSQEQPAFDRFAHVGKGGSKYQPPAEPANDDEPPARFNEVPDFDYDGPGFDDEADQNMPDVSHLEKPEPATSQQADQESQPPHAGGNDQQQAEEAPEVDPETMGGNGVIPKSQPGKLGRQNIVQMAINAGHPLGSLARAVALAIQLPEQSTFLNALGAVSTLAVYGYEVRNQYGSAKPTGLYVCVTQPPSSGKSPAHSSWHQPIREALKPINLKRQREITRLKNRLKILQKKADTPEMLEECEELYIAIQNAPQPIKIHLTDATPEAIDAKCLSVNNGVFTIASDEQPAFNTVLGSSYGDKSNKANKGALLQGWSGDHFNSLRMNRDTYEGTVKGAVNIFAQSGAIETLIAHAPAGDGLIERFLMLDEPDLMGNRELDTHPMPNLTPYGHAVALMAERLTAEEPEDGFTPLYFDEESRQIFTALRKRLEPKFKAGGDYESQSMKGYAGKIDAQAVKIAANLHLLDWFIKGNKEEPPARIPPRWLELAINIAEEMAERYRSILVQRGVIGRKAEWLAVLGYMEKKPGGRTNIRTMLGTIKDYPIFNSRTKARLALDELIEQGLVTANPERTIATLVR